MPEPKPKPFNPTAHARLLARRPGSRWRFQTGGSLHIEPRGGTSLSERFDEVVVDDWLHAEMMDAHSCFVSVAGLSLWLKITKDGARITSMEVRAEGVVGEQIKAKLLATSEKGAC